MRKNHIILLTIFLVSAVCIADTEPKIKKTCQKACCAKSKEKPQATEVAQILAKLRKSTDNLTSYQADIEYTIIYDPEMMLDSKTLRKGNLSYIREKGSSKLRINFHTVKYDDDAEQNDRQDFFFDGVWLTKVDYKLKTVDFIQQQKADNPIDAFEYIGENFPLVGFSRTEQLEKDFEITLPQQTNDPNSPIHLDMKVKKDSHYKDQYRHINFSIDKISFLPAAMVTTSTDDNKYDIRLLNPKINKNIKNLVFKLETPAHFDKIRTPLK